MSQDTGSSPSARTRHIVALGGLRARPGATPPIVGYLLALTGKPRPRVCYLPTARGDQAEGIVQFHARLAGAAAERTHLGLFDRTVRDLRGFLLSQDLIWVGGGNTANMLAVWRVHGVDRVLREAWEAGIVLCGGSAGSLCWFECGTTDSFDLNALAPLEDGLGLLPGSHCPHYDGEAQRRPLYHRLIADGFPPGYAIDDDAAIHFVGQDVAEVVSARDGATAYRVERRDGRVVETPLAARPLPERVADRGA
jgi:peptidase E